MRIVRILNLVPPIVYLWTAIVIFAASSSVTRKIIKLGQNHLINGINPISLCNVLFIGNICALLVMIVLFHPDWRWQQLRQLKRIHWLSLTLVAILAGALAPAMIFMALDRTTVTNVILIGRLEPSLTLALGIWFLRVRVNGWTIASSLVAFIGVAVTAFLTQSSQFVKIMGIHFGSGDILVAGGALFLSIATIISQKYLRGIPFGIVSGYRTLFGTIIFFFLALHLYGANHFAEAFSPYLWAWMLVYGAIIVVMGQLCWFKGLSGSTAAEITLANSFNPIAAIIFAYLLLGEVPTPSQYVGGSIILLGIILGLIGSYQRKKMPIALMMGLTTTGFKGV
jgi:drug/metabolite transporter (DMT)-like permease